MHKTKDIQTSNIWKDAQYYYSKENANLKDGQWPIFYY